MGELARAAPVVSADAFPPEAEDEAMSPASARL